MEKVFLVTSILDKVQSVRKKKLPLAERVKLAIEVAELLLNLSNLLQTSEEKKKNKELSYLVQETQTKNLITALTDQAFRSLSSLRVADQSVYLLKKYGIPAHLSFFEKIFLKLFKIFGNQLPRLFVSILKHVIHEQTKTVILSEEKKNLEKHILKRKKEKIHLNLNHLGEAILGEDEAIKRLNTYLLDLANPHITYVSVKISSIYSQINLLAWKEAIEVISSRLRKLYQAAIDHPHKNADGNLESKFVNLDMEEYRDLHLTITVFKKVLEEPEFLHLRAGIVLQSYLPDSYLLQQDLTIWAKQRVAKGGAPIKLRIVKGANLAMEHWESAVRLWPSAPYSHKIEVDANYKRMLIYAMTKDHTQAVQIGVGSHNLFDIAFALLLRAENDLETQVQFEMLEGMAPSMRRAVHLVSHDMLLYCPLTNKQEFQNAVAYLVRRLDENTAPENFLSHIFNLKTTASEWKEQVKAFENSCDFIESVSYLSKRNQNRFHSSEHAASHFQNEPDTDWSLPVNRAWLELVLKQWQNKKLKVPLNVGGNEKTSKETKIGVDPSYPNQAAYEYSLATSEDIDIAIETAKLQEEALGKVSPSGRARQLFKIAENLKNQRGNLIGAMILDTGKTALEADIEISEAIDFANYYAYNLLEWTNLKDISWQPKGTILVASPWNFPCSIPAGGILAALAAGNCVLFKPAPEAVLVGWILATIFWESGVDPRVLQFIACDDGSVGTNLIKDPRLSAIILTGATSTAKFFITQRPTLDLMAETGGKNTLVISRLSDRDLAIKDLLQSAFGHAGQKCSACSLAILEAEVYDDPHFLNQLKNAAASLSVGLAWDLKTKINPLIRSPGEELLKGLTTLEEGESWLLEPKQDLNNPNLWSPGIKLGVKPSSFTFQTELFGPVLGLVRASSFQEALVLMNQTKYGLTAGIHSLDERELKKWLTEIIAGNCYLNRTTTGAIVQRQPFGGCKASSFGRGLKAGGPNYLLQMMQASQIKMPIERAPYCQEVRKLMESLQTTFKLLKSDIDILKIAGENYAFYWRDYFSKQHDLSLVRGEDNLQVYTPYEEISLIVTKDVDLTSIFLEIIAALTCQTSLKLYSLNASFHELFYGLDLPSFIQYKGMSFEEISEEIKNEKVKRLRVLSSLPSEIEEAFALFPCPISQGPPLINGRLQLLHYLREVSISYDYHRYGNLGDRDKEQRTPLS